MCQIYIERNPIHLNLEDSLHFSFTDSPLAREVWFWLTHVHTWYSTVQYSTVQYRSTPGSSRCPSRSRCCPGSTSPPPPTSLWLPSPWPPAHSGPANQMKTAVTCCLASYRVAAPPPVSVGLLPGGVKHGGVLVIQRAGVVQPAGGAHSDGVPPSQPQVHALAGGGAALDDSNAIADVI